LRTLALPDEILLKVEKPGRYIGGEVGSVAITDQERQGVRFCLCFPDVYEIGMSHLGSQILYGMLNDLDGVTCERLYAPWIDLAQEMREADIPLFALESQDPVKTFDFLGFTLQYEMCYTNILEVLSLAKIPFYAKDRTEDHPIIIGGGPVVYNPEPVADFFDLFVIGEGEAILPQLMQLYYTHKQTGQAKQTFLKAAAALDGIYVPAFYTAYYDENGRFQAIQANTAEAKEKVQKVIVTDMDAAPYPMHPIVPYIKVTQDRIVLEVMRGCIRGCRFCQAGMVYRPTREHSLAQLKTYAKTMLDNTGHDEISLSSLSTSDYSKLQELVYYLIEEYKDQKVNISLPSLRIDSFALDVMGKVQDVRKSSITFAPEAGTQRMRDVINKGLDEEMILSGASKAFAAGWTKVKLYFMLGLPTETAEDVLGIPHLAEQIARTYYEIPKAEREGKCQITISTSFFIPKPHTPLQWAAMQHKEDYVSKAAMVKNEVNAMLNRKSLRYQWHEADVTILEGLFSRGDRKLSNVLVKAFEKGCRFDAWSEHFHYDKWLEAIADCDIDLADYIYRERDIDEVFPWDHIDVGVDKTFLQTEWERARTGVITPNCREQCSTCGAMSYGCGVCIA